MIPDEIKNPLKFLGVVLIILLTIMFVNFEIFTSSLIYTYKLFLNLIPTLLLVLLMMGLFNFFIKPKHLIKYLGKKKPIRAWLVSSSLGIISSGPIYLWYPLLSEARDKGVTNNSITIFLYNRAVKPALIPLMIFYFGWIYVVVLTIVMIFIGGLNGYFVEKIMEMKK